MTRRHRPTGQIVVATDFSDLAFGAARIAADQARRVGARLTLVHIAEKGNDVALWMSTAFGSAYPFVREQSSSGRTDAEERLSEELAQLGVHGDARLVDGEPASAIVDVAEELDADLVVIGATGRSAVRGMLTGGVAEEVTHEAPCTVLVVRRVGLDRDLGRGLGIPGASPTRPHS